MFKVLVEILIYTFAEVSMLNLGIWSPFMATRVKKEVFQGPNKIDALYFVVISEGL